MVSPHRNYLRWSTAALVLSGYLAMASVATIGPLILVIPLFALSVTSFAERLDAKYASYGVATRALTIAYCCFLPLSWIQFGLMAAVVTLAIFIQVYTLVHRKTARNYYHLYLMSLFLLLAACVQSPEPIIGFVLILFLISGVWSNIMLRVVVEEERLEKPTSVDVVSLDYLKQHGKPDNAGSFRQGVPAMAGLISLAILVLTAFTFVLTPRMEAGILGRNQTVAPTTGVGEKVDLQGGGTISQDETPVMIVKFPDEEGGRISDPDWLYWRITTLNEYQGDSWTSFECSLLDPGIRSLTNQRRTQADQYRVDRNVRTGQRLVRQSIYMDDVPRVGLPVLDLVQRVQVDENTRGVEVSWSSDRDFTVRLNKAGARRLSYDAWSEPGDPTADVLRNAPEDFSGIKGSDYALFTKHALSPESVALARQVTESEATLYDKVYALERFLSSEAFLYTLEIPPVESGSVIDSFINVTRRGHCELFATAMALMLRSQGIPTRVVRGYRGGEWSESDLSYTIRASMAHLWVEVWFPEYGWIVFDPSPQADERERSAYDRLALLASRALLKSKMFWFSEVVGFDRGAQVERLRNFTVGLVANIRADSDTESTVVPGTRTRFGFIVPIVLVLFIVSIVFVMARRLRWVRVPRGLILTRDQIRVVRLYLLLRQRLMRYRVDCAGKTAEELAAELQSSRWGAPGAALEVLQLYNTVRFGFRPVPAGRIPELRRAILKMRPVED